MKRDFNYKYHQKEFNRINENISPTARSIRRAEKAKIDRLRALVTDKFWFDSLTVDEKQSVHSNWFFTFPNFTSRPTWYNLNTDKRNHPLDGERVEEYCKRMTPGCKNTQRDMKLNKLLSGKN